METEIEKQCQHKFIYRCEEVDLKAVMGGWYKGKRVIIYCENCGKVSHDVVNDCYNSQNYS